MARSREHIEALLELSEDERSAAAAELLASLEPESDPGADEAWAVEIQRRLERNAPGIRADEVFAAGRARLKRIE